MILVWVVMRKFGCADLLFAPYGFQQFISNFAPCRSNLTLKIFSAPKCTCVLGSGATILLSGLGEAYALKIWTASYRD